MKVLIACEESQRVCTAFRAKGHEAYSCDIQDCSGGHKEWHIKGNVLPLLNGGGYDFKTQDGKRHIVNNWDMIIAFPPCTYLTNAGMCNFTRKNSDNIYRLKRLKNLYESVKFVNDIWQSDCNKIVIENPVGVLSTYFAKPTQIIHPYEFGHSVNKSTCLWIKGVNPLIPTNIVEKDKIIAWGNGNKISKWYRETLSDCAGNLEELSKIRSKTFEGIASAMAEQWGSNLQV